MTKGIIVIGGHVQGLGITRIFGKNKIPVIVLDYNRYNIAKHSKYCMKFFLYRKESLLSFLISDELTKKYSNWLIFPTDDEDVRLLSENKETLEHYYKLSTCEWNIISKFYNKINTYHICEKLGINIPKTFYPKDLDDIKKTQINYPVIIKPAVMHTFYKKTKKKVFLCNNDSDLISNYLKAIKIIPNSEIMIQEIINGSSDNQYSVCFYFSDKIPVVSLLAKRKRQHPIDFGNATTFAETTFEPMNIYTDAVKLLKYVNYEGIAEVEFKKDDKSNKLYLLEVNPRTWKWHTIAENSNSPFLLSIYEKIYFNKPIISNKWRKAYFRHLTTDIPISILMYLKGIYKKTNYDKTIYAVWDSQDFLPFIFELIYLPYFILKR